MKKIITVLCSFITMMGYAQPVINHNNLPVVGDHVVISICSNILDPGAAGPDQTWDMSHLAELEEQFFTYITPSEGMLPDSFPNANLCAVSWLNDYSYYNTSEEALSIEGYVITFDSGDTSVIAFDNTEQTLELPYTYNTNFTDNFNGSLYIPGFSGLTFQGTMDFEADGYGTLILPNGTFTNVVRYHFFRTQTNYINGIPGQTQTKEQWAWVSSDYRFWLLLMEENWDGFTMQPLIWYDKNPYSVATGIPSNHAEAKYTFPNPLRKGEKFYINWDRNETAEVSILKLDGSLIGHEHVSFITGSNSFDHFDMNSGLYILKIETSEKVLTQRISVLN